MKLQHAARSAARGFTLLEIAVVLVIAMLLIGIGAVMASSLMNENAMHKAVTQIEVLGAEAVRRASTTRRQQVILFHEDRCELVDEASGSIRSAAYPANAQMTLQRYFDTKTTPAEGQSLRVLPGCLLEPLSLTLTSSSGEFQFGLDPLTGGFQR